MTRDSSQASGPLSRWVNVERLPQGHGTATVEASPAECAALAADFGIPGIRDLVGRFAIEGATSRLTVTGTVEALVTQVCTVSLEPFEAPVREPVEVVFTDTDRLAGTDAEDADIPDPLVGGRIDFGALTAEFLALGLDPYPRKPGIAFEPVVAGDEAGPLDGLRKLRDRDG
jgi:Large ribosomal RNA subunit accumulation protein YceD